MIKRFLLGCAVFVFLIVLYLLFWPVPFDPVAWIPQKPPQMTGDYEPNTKLTAIERLEVGFGPEDVAFDDQGRLYTGLEDGRIMRFKPGMSKPEVFCDTKGRPLGLEFDAAGSLIVADPKRGLLEVSPKGEITVLCDTVNGVPVRYADDLDIGSDKAIYFSDVSTKYSDAMLEFFEQGPNGLLILYDPNTRQAQVLLHGLYCANGVAVSPDQSYVLVTESFRYRVQRYWLTGPKKGQSDVFIDNLPGCPDNITFNGDDTYWLALALGPKFREASDPFLSKPFLRKFYYRLPGFIKGETWRTPAEMRCGYVLGLDLDGRIIHNLQDPSGEKYADITSATEYEGMLYFGSVGEDAVGRIPIP
jgi:sugar lactone lactonase YvrE